MWPFGKKNNTQRPAAPRPTARRSTSSKSTSSTTNRQNCGCYSVNGIPANICATHLRRLG